VNEGSGKEADVLSFVEFEELELSSFEELELSSFEELELSSFEELELSSFEEGSSTVSSSSFAFREEIGKDMKVPR
jgi:hypothetical protein